MNQISKSLTAAVVVVAAYAVGWAEAKAADADWPNRPIRLVVPFPAGGGVDVSARIAADALRSELGQPVVIENISGASGVLGARTVITSQPDGYTFLFAGAGIVTTPLFDKSLGFNPSKDLVGVSLITRYPLVLVTSLDTPAKSLEEFVALVRANPGKYTYASVGPGTSTHVGVTLLMAMANIDLTAIYYRGNGAALPDLMAGRISLVLDGYFVQAPLIEKGSVRLLAVTTPERFPQLPNVPAVSEVVKGYQFPYWTAIFAPAATPKAIVDKFSAIIKKALSAPAVQKQFADLAVEAVPTTPEGMDKFYKDQREFLEPFLSKITQQ